MNRLFVYGTLRPGECNAHIMEAIGGEWQPASVIGCFYTSGTGAASSFPGVVIDPNGAQINGYLFISDSLDKHWEALDAFEEGYDRIRVTVTTDDQQQVSAWLYQLQPESIPCQ